MAVVGAIAFTVILVGAVLWDEFAPPPTPDNAQEIADFCLGDHSNIGVHYHPVLEIVINGQQITSPPILGQARRMLNERCIHDSTGLRVEMNFVMSQSNLLLGWGETFNENQILDYVVDEDHEIVVTLDGEE